MKRTPNPDFLSEIKRLLAYDPETGLITWKIDRPGTRGAGSEAGTTRVDGYRVLRVCNHTFTAGQIAWFLGTGNWPTENIYFNDGNPCNTRPDNLSHGPRRFATAEAYEAFIHRKLPDAIDQDIYWSARHAAEVGPDNPTYGDRVTMDHSFGRYFDHYGVARPATHRECAELVRAMTEGPLS